MSSLTQNPPTADRHITPGGSDWLWAVTALMAISDLAMVAWSFMRPRGTRLFHQLAIIILTTATISYFSMASDLGATATRAEFSRGNTNTRQIWYVRYIQWFITFPLLLLELLLATGLTLSDIITTLFMAWVLVICGLVGALVPSTYKWGFYVFGLLALFYIWHILLGFAPRSTFSADGFVRTGFVRGAWYLSFLLLLYPIAWGCSEGGNVISPTGEMIWYGILDLFAGPIFLFGFLFSLRNLDYATLGLASGKHTDTGYGAGAGIGAGTGYGAGAAGTGPGMANTGPGMINAGNGVTGPGVAGPNAVHNGAVPAAGTSTVV
ncbi:heat shock protein 30 [Amylocystis lapponica]|nr:heat shock protein 30 [Amylocystis lapponica]